MIDKATAWILQCDGCETSIIVHSIMHTFEYGYRVDLPDGWVLDLTDYKHYCPTCRMEKLL